MRNLFRTTLALSAIVALTACGGEKNKSSDDQAAGGKSSAEPTAPAAKATGKTIVVELYSDEKGNYFKPNRIQAHQGDLIQFTLMTGVHNVHFLPDSNPGAQGLPAASEFLQLPDQTWDYVVGLAHGKYYFQCDVHPFMNGFLIVTTP